MYELKNPSEGRPTVRWLWEMPLRGLHTHRESLESVTLICSKESILQAHWFGKILTERYLQSTFPKLRQENIRILAQGGKSVELIPCEECTTHSEKLVDFAWDFENYQELFDGMSKMLDNLIGENKREQDIMIDVTGGQKTNSGVEAIITVNRRAKFQYVQTGGENSVVYFDLVTPKAFSNSN